MFAASDQKISPILVAVRFSLIDVMPIVFFVFIRNKGFLSNQPQPNANLLKKVHFMKFITMTILTLVCVSSAFASENESELDELCAPIVTIYAKAVARVQFPHARVTGVKIIRNGYAEQPVSSTQVWGVNFSKNGSFATAIILHTYWSDSGSCDVIKIIPNAVQ